MWSQVSRECGGQGVQSSGPGIIHKSPAPLDGALDGLPRNAASGCDSRFAPPKSETHRHGSMSQRKYRSEQRFLMP